MASLSASVIEWPNRHSVAEGCPPVVFWVSMLLLSQRKRDLEGSLHHYTVLRGGKRIVVPQAVRECKVSARQLL